ncbi:MAG: hypothetical protein ACQEUT_07345 [Bacillota bacterium]
MKVIASHPYYVVTRKIESNVQASHESEHELLLNGECIECSRKSFWLKDVFDMSYKSLNKGKGFLYLHTNQGVFSFYVKQDPGLFIQEYKKLQ